MRRALLVITGLMWLSAGPALAQDDGVHIDPDSPTAKEYALPLDSARRQARGGGNVHPSAAASTPAPRFGEGVGDDDGAASGSGGSGSGKGSGKGSGGSSSGGSGDGPPSGNATGGASGTTTATGVASRPGAPDGGGIGTTLMVIGGAAALLLVGGGAGYALRRRDVSPS